MENKQDSGYDDTDDISAILGDDIVCEILRRLTVKSLMQLKCVCKLWRTLIQDNPHFIDLHLTHSKTRPFLLITVPKEDEVCFFSTGLFEGRAAIHRFKSPSSSDKPFRALKPINGLISYVRNDFEAGACIYNVSTQAGTPWIKSTIQKEEEKHDVFFHTRNNCYRRYGFGFDPITKEHKLICIWHIFRYKTSQKNGFLRVDRVCEVLTVGHHTWKRINDVPPVNKFCGIPSSCVNGTIYWLSSHERQSEVILAFDVGTEKFRVIPIPKFIPDYFPKNDESFNCLSCNGVELMEVDGRITLIDTTCRVVNNDTICRMWIYDDVDKEKSVTSNSNKYGNWVEETITMSFDWQREEHQIFQAIPGTDLIVIKPRKPVDDFVSLYYYDRKKKISRKIEINVISSIFSATPILYNVTVFVESLLPVQNQQLRHTHLPSGN